MKTRGAEHYRGGQEALDEAYECGLYDSKPRMVNGTLKLDEEDYWYKGTLIRKTDILYNPWLIGAHHNGNTFPTLKEAKKYVDETTTTTKEEA